MPLFRASDSGDSMFQLVPLPVISSDCLQKPAFTPWSAMGNLLGVGILNTRETYTAVVVNGDQSQLVMRSGILKQDGL